MRILVILIVCSIIASVSYGSTVSLDAVVDYSGYSCVTSVCEICGLKVYRNSGGTTSTIDGAFVLYYCPGEPRRSIEVSEYINVCSDCYDRYAKDFKSQVHKTATDLKNKWKAERVADRLRNEDKAKAEELKTIYEQIKELLEKVRKLESK